MGGGGIVQDGFSLFVCIKGRNNLSRFWHDTTYEGKRSMSKELQCYLNLVQAAQK